VWLRWWWIFAKVVFLHFPYPRLYFRLGLKKVTMKNKAKHKAKHKGKPPQEKPEENPLENEIEDMIEREKTRRRIVDKLIKQPFSPEPKDTLKQLNN
jgi:hypothetical protein